MNHFQGPTVNLPEKLKRLPVGGLEHVLVFPTDFHIFQRGWNHQAG